MRFTPPRANTLLAFFRVRQEKIQRMFEEEKPEKPEKPPEKQPEWNKEGF